MKILQHIFFFLLLSIILASCKSDSKTDDSALEDLPVTNETQGEPEIKYKDIGAVDTSSIVPSIHIEKVEKKTRSAEQKVKKKAEKIVVKKEVEKRPVISFEEPVHQFGELKTGEKYAHKFIFKNTGNSDLVIESATPSCGCTVPSYPFIPIAPGESGYIGVIYNSVGKSGRQTPDIKVKTNATPATYTISLAGEVIE